MKTFIIGFYYALYMLGIALKRIKLNYIKKFKGEEAAREYIAKVARNWSDFTLKAIGMDLEVIGKENIPKETCLFVANHQSYIDIPVLLKITGKPIGFIGKKELEKVPILRSWMLDIKSIFLDRNNVREGIKAINKGIEYLKEGTSMAIFPEGTRSKSENMNEFKKGSLKLATKSGALIVPITIDGTYKSLEETGRVQKVKVKVIIDKPIDPKKLSKEEQNSLSEQVREIIYNNLKNLK